MKQPRIAICFFGITRSLRHTISSIEENILAPARANGSVTVLSHFFEQTQIENPRSGEAGALDPTEHRLLGNDWLELEAPEAAFERWDFEALKAYGDVWNDEFRSLRNLVQQQHSLHRVTEAALKTDPDLVIFCRPDLCYRDNFEVQIKKGLADRWPTVRLPAWQPWHGYNDRFALARGSRAIRAYGQRMDMAQTYCRWQEAPLLAEGLVAFALRRRLIRVKTMGLRANRVRVGGVMVDENFTPPAWRDTFPATMRRHGRLIALKTGTMKLVPRRLRHKSFEQE